MNSISHARPAFLEQQFDDPLQQRESSVFGMWAFLATEILFFGVLFLGYAICRWRFPVAFAEAAKHTDLVLGSIETAVLLVSSCVVTIALRDLRLGGRRLAAALLLATAMLGLLFLALHGKEYYDEFHEGLMPGVHYTLAQPHAVHMKLFFCLYYFITLYHSLHVTVGVLLLLAMSWRTFRGGFSADYTTPVEVTSMYWHLVDIVWIFVFPLMYLVGR
ncbi:MAG TPA: cytochrome c oxidase subunit 3 [Rhodanobacteraceae bacterium]|nr:cytochrome c oxidase subunit 3 [Rhodanobacteraceae bacterium]